MKEIKFDKKKYVLPTSWSEVTFKQFRELMKVNAGTMGDIEKAARIAAVFTDLTYDELIDGNPYLISKVVNELDFIDKALDYNKPVVHFKIDDETFYVRDLEDASFREYADFQTINKIFAEKPEEGYLLKLAILCRKVGEKPLKEKDLKARAELFENLDAETVLGINSFFLLRRKLSQQASHQYSMLRAEVTEKELSLRRILANGGAGTGWLTRWRNLLLSFNLYLIRKLPMSWLTMLTK
ncbi:hypothetical protein [Rufibacter ruber]|uniref:hypothetical protein n=1 Tax=Rufibacter ruber TaxID=1783499 RepID=UPI00082D93F6|nr:hypothetical protein [Rufibacter ruber]